MLAYAYQAARQHPFSMYQELTLAHRYGKDLDDTLIQSLNKTLASDPKTITEHEAKTCATALFDILRTATPSDACRTLKAIAGASDEPGHAFRDLPLNLREATLRFISPTQCFMTHLELKGDDLRGLNLSMADLHHARFDNVSFVEANLSGADLPNALFDGVSFVNTNLTGADMCAIRGLRANFSGAVLEDATLMMDETWFVGTGTSQPEWLARIQDCLSPNDNGWEMLTSIASIDNRYADIKRALMCQVIDALERCGVANNIAWDFMPSWLQVLADPIFWESWTIACFINTYLPVGLVVRWNYVLAPADLPVEQLNTHLQYLLALDDRSDWVRRHQGSIHQLTCLASEHDVLKPLVKQLTQRFLCQPDIIPIAAALNQILPGIGEDTCIFLGEDGLTATACDPALIKAVILEAPDVPWHCVYPLRRENETAPYTVSSALSPETALRPSALLLDRYLDVSGLERDRYAALLNAFWPGHDASTPMDDGEPMSTKLAVLRARYQQCALEMLVLPLSMQPHHNLTTIEWQMHLQTLFQDVTQLPKGANGNRQAAGATVRLHPDVETALWEVCRSQTPDLGDSTVERAAFKFVEALKLVHLSSSQAFGTETSSPFMLRYVACALLNEAMADNPALMPDTQVTQWRNALLGNTTEMATCTSTLSYEMMEFIREAPPESHLEKLYGITFPRTWRD